MKKINIVEIGPRDGFQSVKEYIPKETKIQIIDGLVEAGLKKIQCTSFVSPKAIPQMQDADYVARAVLEKHKDTAFFALVPNFFGAKAAYDAGLREITPVISLSEAHNKANVNRTHQESFDELQRIMNEFPELKINLDVATVFGCPFEGEQEISKLVDFVGTLNKMGVKAFSLCDTIGVAYPNRVKEVVSALSKNYSDIELSIHIHDTRNMGIINSYTAINEGIENVQVAVAGLGGCPFAPGATGNTSTEDLVYMLEKEGIDTGINFEKLLEVAKFAKENIKGNFSGHHINITTKQCGFN